MEIDVTPNPFTDFVEIRIAGEEFTDNLCILTLSDQNGKLLRMAGISLEKENNHFALERLSSLDSGSYRLLIKNQAGELIFNRVLHKE